MNYTNDKDKPVNELLLDYLRKNNISNKKIADEFGYSPAAMSDYLSGKKTKDSKLNIIASLYLELRANEKGEIVAAERIKYENLLKEKNQLILDLEAEIKALNMLIDRIDKRNSEQSDIKKIGNNS